MDEVRLRLRQPSDLHRCVAVLAEVHRADHYPLNWPADPAGWLTPAGTTHAWVAEIASAVVGHVTVSGTEVGRLFVAPAARRRGVAAGLLDAVRAWAAVQQMALTLEIVDAPRSAPAMDLYERTGWQHTRTTTASWTAADGSPVRLRHYVLEPHRSSSRLGRT
jgi:GNAT superfamily N-acetyltransferase